MVEDVVFVGARGRRLLGLGEPIFRELGITAMAVARREPGFQYPEKRVEAFAPRFAAGALRPPAPDLSASPISAPEMMSRRGPAIVLRVEPYRRARVRESHVATAGFARWPAARSTSSSRRTASSMSASKIRSAILGLTP